jgi:hypothetical protein
VCYAKTKRMGDGQQRLAVRVRLSLHIQACLGATRMWTLSAMGLGREISYIRAKSRIIFFCSAVRARHEPSPRGPEWLRVS